MREQILAFKMNQGGNKKHPFTMILTVIISVEFLLKSILGFDVFKLKIFFRTLTACGDKRRGGGIARQLIKVAKLSAIGQTKFQHGCLPMQYFYIKVYLTARFGKFKVSLQF